LSGAVVEAGSAVPVLDPNLSVQEGEENGVAAGSLRMLSLRQWHQRIVVEEGGVLKSDLYVREVMARLEVKLFFLARPTYDEPKEPSQALNLYITYDPDTDPTNVGKKGPRCVVTRRGEGRSYVPYIGKVVDEATATLLPKATTLPLFDTADENYEGLRLFIDGSKELNILKSDACIAWHVPPLALPKKNADAAVDASASGERAAKKAKVDAPVAGNPPKKKEILATHKIQYEAFAIPNPIGLGEIKFQRPILVDNLEHVAFEKPLFRKLETFDLDTKVKTQRSSIHRSFVHR
jgi:hypothetical protein